MAGGVRRACEVPEELPQLLGELVRNDEPRQRIPLILQQLEQLPTSTNHDDLPHGRVEDGQDGPTSEPIFADQPQKMLVGSAVISSRSTWMVGVGATRS